MSTAMQIWICSSPVVRNHASELNEQKTFARANSTYATSELLIEIQKTDGVKCGAVQEEPNACQVKGL